MLDSIREIERLTALLTNRSQLIQNFFTNRDFPEWSDALHRL